MARRRGKPRTINLKQQRIEVSMFELRFPGEEPAEVHDFIMDAFVNDKISLGKARRMLAQCVPVASIVEHEVP